MNYSKIVEIATQCLVKQNQITEYYRLLGANPNIEDICKKLIYTTIDEMKLELKKLESKLHKQINPYDI